MYFHYVEYEVYKNYKSKRDPDQEVIDHNELKELYVGWKGEKNFFWSDTSEYDTAYDAFEILNCQPLFFD